MDLKSIGLCPQGFEPPRCRISATACSGTSLLVSTDRACSYVSTSPRVCPVAVHICRSNAVPGMMSETLSYRTFKSEPTNATSIICNRAHCILSAICCPWCSNRSHEGIRRLPSVSETVLLWRATFVFASPVGRGAGCWSGR